jgi:EmrB/QacA subfamily drug resistance transporter
VTVDALTAGESRPWLFRERRRPDRVRSWPGAWMLTVATVCFGAFMGQLDASAVTLVYRPVEAQFGAGLAGVEWISLAYLLVLVALLVPVGRLSDAFGRKLVYLYGFAVFTAASLACGLAPSLSLLIAFRVVQALGAAMLQANSVALITTSVPHGRRRAALGVQAGAQAFGLALGPTLGGVLVATIGWRWVFFVNLPVGIAALVAGYYLLPRTQQRSRMAGLDWWSVVVLAVATTGLLLGLSSASGLALSGPLTIAWLAAAVLAGWRFVVRQQSHANALVDPSLFRDPEISRGLLGALCGYLVLFGPLVLVPVGFAARGLSALTAGLTLTALPIGFALGALVGPELLPTRWPERRRAALGGLMCSAGLAAALFGPETASFLAPSLALVGAGLGVFTPSNNAMIMGAVPSRAAATAGGLLNMTRGLGTALGVAVVTLAFHLGSSHPGGLRGGRLAWSVLLAVAALLTWTTRIVRRDEPR